MKLPKVIADLVKAQDNFDSIAYANCFSETAIVFDEGKTHQGKAEIHHWIETANEAYKTVMKPLDYAEADEVLKAEVSGDFEGSPILLNYHFELKDGLIHSLKIIP